jgi:hypothetical protein
VCVCPCVYTGAENCMKLRFSLDNVFGFGF